MKSSVWAFIAVALLSLSTEQGLAVVSDLPSPAPQEFDPALKETCRWSMEPGDGDPEPEQAEVRKVFDETVVSLEGELHGHDAYYRTVRTLRMMTSDEVRLLGIRFAALRDQMARGPDGKLLPEIEWPAAVIEARNAVMDGVTPLLIYIVRKRFSWIWPEHFLDLVQDAALVTAKLLRVYDPTHRGASGREMRVSHFVFEFVPSPLRHEAQKYRLIKPSQYEVEYWKLKKDIETHFPDGETEIEVLAQKYKVTPSLVRTLMLSIQSRSVVSRDANPRENRKGDTDSDLGNFLDADEAPEGSYWGRVELTLDQPALQSEAKSFAAKLSREEQEIFWLTVYSGQPLTFSEMGQLMGVSPEWARRRSNAIQDRFIDELRRKYGITELEVGAGAEPLRRGHWLTSGKEGTGNRGGRAPIPKVKVPELSLSFARAKWQALSKAHQAALRSSLATDKQRLVLDRLLVQEIPASLIELAFDLKMPDSGVLTIQTAIFGHLYRFVLAHQGEYSGAKQSFLTHWEGAAVESSKGTRIMIDPEVVRSVVQRLNPGELEQLKGALTDRQWKIVERRYLVSGAAPDAKALGQEWGVTPQAVNNDEKILKFGVLKLFSPDKIPAGL